MKKLSKPQIDTLRYAKGRELYAKDITEGNGNRRRTLLWLIDHGMLTWDPILHGRVVLTDLGARKLDEARNARRTGRRIDPPGTLRIQDIGDRRVITLTGIHEEKP